MQIISLLSTYSFSGALQIKLDLFLLKKRFYFTMLPNFDGK